MVKLIIYIHLHKWAVIGEDRCALFQAQCTFDLYNAISMVLFYIQLAIIVLHA